MTRPKIAPARIAFEKGGKRMRQEVRTVWTQDGLAVTASIDDDGAWVVTHTPSGYAALRGFRIQRDAIAAARNLLLLGDWTQSRSRLSRRMKMGTIVIRNELHEKGITA